MDTYSDTNKRKAEQVPVDTDENGEEFAFRTALGELFDWKKPQSSLSESLEELNNLRRFLHLRCLFPPDYEFYKTDAEELSISSDLSMWKDYEFYKTDAEEVSISSDLSMWKDYEIFKFEDEDISSDLSMWKDYEFFKIEEEGISSDLSMWKNLDDHLRFFRIDHSTGIPLYKLDYIPGSRFFIQSSGFYDLSFATDQIVATYQIIEVVGSSIPKNTRHVSVRCSIDSSYLRNLYVAEKLQTLLILRGAGSRISILPHDLFQKLLFLEILDLSHTDIAELPSSIGHAPRLRYLNLSYTSLAELPSSLCNILTLQILKLRGCLKLRGLPKAIRRLTSLRHLDVDVSFLLVSMPPRVGELNQLQLLPAFVINKKHGWHINELKNLNDLRQTLRILRLENVSSLEEAEGAFLHEKHLLEKLEFHWSRFVDGFWVLESLRPSESIKELEISGYGGVKFPNWIGSIFSLTAITIHNCSKCNVLPTLGRLPSLKLLHISHMNEVKVIAQEFHGDGYSKDIVFPGLEQLTFNGMPELTEWIGVKKNDFPVLQKLSISACSKLTALPELSFFQSLRHLEISLCSSLASIPAGVLSVSLQSIVIVECPKLEERYRRDGENWGKIAHIRFKFI